MSLPTVPRLPVRVARALQVALAVLGIVGVLALTVLARSQPPPDRGPSWRLVIVPDTTTQPGYTPSPAGPPCPAANGEGSR